MMDIEKLHPSFCKKLCITIWSQFGGCTHLDANDVHCIVLANNFAEKLQRNDANAFDWILLTCVFGYFFPLKDPMNPNETVIVIRSLVPGGVAQQDGRLIPGDRLLFVNETVLENATLDMAVQALKGAPKGKVVVGVAKPLPLPESSNQSTPSQVSDTHKVTQAQASLASRGFASRGFTANLETETFSATSNTLLSLYKSESF